MTGQKLAFSICVASNMMASALMAQPIPAWGDVEMLVPDLSIRLGDTVVTTFPGVPAKQRVCGIRLHMGEGTGLTQTLTTRQLHP